MKNIYCIVGESGAGKSRVVEELCKRYGLIELCSYTTRKPRFKGENSHQFVSGMTIGQIHQDYPDIVAETVFDGQMYWCTQAQADAADLYVVDPAGLEMFRERYHGKKGIKAIYLKATGVTRRLRMANRGDDPAQIEARISHDRKAFAEVANLVDITVWNDALVTAVQEIWDYIQNTENKKGRGK